MEADQLARTYELRRGRELSFYGALDVDPGEDYTRDDADQAIVRADEILRWAQTMDPEQESNAAP